MTDWTSRRLADVVELRRGFDLPHGSRVLGTVPVVSSGGGSGWHDTAMVEGPGFAIGRATNLGQPTWSDVAYWPLNTTLYVADFYGNDPRWAYHLFQVLDLSGFDSGSVQPMLNRNNIASLLVDVPPRSTQTAIAAVLGALDDKIAANTTLSRAAEELAKAYFALWGRQIATIRLTDIAAPLLGGTPTRSTAHFWGRGENWASARDVVAAPNRVLLSTSETITEAAVNSTIRLQAHPTGSIVLTARGTVGAVARVAEPCAINQSCYAFHPPNGRSALLYFAVLDAVERMRAMAHGSVFSTINVATLDNIDVPDIRRLAQVQADLLDSLLSLGTQAARENSTLEKLRDTLLPALMSGRIRVEDAERQVEDAI